MGKIELHPHQIDSMDLNIQDLHPLTTENLENVYQLYVKNEEFFKISKKDIENQTLGDFSFNPQLSLVYHPTESETPVAIMMGVVKKGYIKNNFIIKMCLVDAAHRRQGIGTWMFGELIKRAKPHLSLLSSVKYGFSPPQFMEPGVDVRHTSLIFFLQSMGLNQRNARKNLTVHIPDEYPEPKTQKHQFSFQRITSEYFGPTLEFIKKEFMAPTWPKEAKLTFNSDRPTTYVALDSEKNVVGFASHSTCFAGSFGPTGVAKSVREKGVGSELLKWCIWDIKQQGLDTCTIMYVVGNTVKYYCKSVGAYINPVFIPMGRWILYWWNLR